MVLPDNQKKHLPPSFGMPVFVTTTPCNNMRHYASKQALRSLRGRAYHFLINIFLGAVIILLISYSVLTHSIIYAHIGLGTFTLFILLSVLFTIKSQSQTCPLCKTAFWSNLKCARNHKVKPTLGLSYRLGVAVSIVTQGRYRCPFCGESFNAKKPRVK